MHDKLKKVCLFNNNFGLAMYLDRRERLKYNANRIKRRNLIDNHIPVSKSKIFRSAKLLEYKRNLDLYDNESYKNIVENILDEVLILDKSGSFFKGNFTYKHISNTVSRKDARIQQAYSDPDFLTPKRVIGILDLVARAKSWLRLFCIYGNLFVETIELNRKVQWARLISPFLAEKFKSEGNDIFKVFRRGANELDTADRGKIIHFTLAPRFFGDKESLYGIGVFDLLEDYYLDIVVDQVRKGFEKGITEIVRYAIALEYSEEIAKMFHVTLNERRGF